MNLPRVLAIITPRRFREEELLVPLEAWRHRLSVCVSSTRRGPARGMGGGTWPVETTVRGLVGSRFDATIVIGGDGALEHLWDDSSVLAALRCTFESGAIVGGICYGVVALARAGVLAGRRATVYPDRRAEIEIARGGAVLTDDALVVDGNIVTARGPSDAQLLAHTLLTRLGA